MTYLSQKAPITLSTLAKYNEREKDEQLREGDVVYLRKKQKKADKKFKNQLHVVKAGESMYLISQLYGMRLASLYKINHLDAGYQIKVGDRLKVY